MDPFIYSFRFCCDPDFNDQQELESLDRYITEACIDDVAVFCNVEELNTGHMTLSEQDRYLQLLKDVERVLRPHGVALSVNHWHSVMHADMGKKMSPELPFRPIVDVEGNAAQLCVCPLDERWQDHLAELYARYAALRPHILWVEDDFRFHNHAPLVWGGCFCEAHMALYSQMAGHPVTREDFIRGVLQPGEPHPYRRIWLDACRRTLVEVAAKLERAVHAVSPETRLGLMTSLPHVHAAEGRDWHGLLRAFAGEKEPPVDRIHLPAYAETAPWQYLLRFNMASMANRALLPPDTLVYPELENYPFSRFSKSLAFTRFQLLSSLPLDPAGMTMDLYDLNGNGIVWEEGYQDMLRQVKPFLNEMKRTGAFGGERMGVRVLLSERSSYTLHTRQGRGMEELYPQETFWAGYLSACGVPFRFQTDIPAGETAAVSGQYLRNLEEEDVRRLFRDNFVLLTGDALETLADMGLGELADLKSLRWMERDGGEYAFEQVANGMICCGISQARASAAALGSDAVLAEYGGTAEVYTAFYDSFRRETGPAQVVAAGGRVMVFPFGRLPGAAAMPQMFLNTLRREVLRDILLHKARLAAPVVEGPAYLQPYCTRDEERLYIYLVNAALDPAAGWRLHIESADWRRASLYFSDGRREEMAVPPDGGALSFPQTVGPMETVLIVLKKEEE